MPLHLGRGALLGEGFGEGCGDGGERPGVGGCRCAEREDVEGWWVEGCYALDVREGVADASAVGGGLGIVVGGAAGCVGEVDVGEGREGDAVDVRFV